MKSGNVISKDLQACSRLFLNPFLNKALAAFLDGLKLFGMGYSWGGYESLVIPFDCSSYRTATKFNAPGPALRFSIGLEDPEDLKADLARDLSGSTASADKSRGGCWRSFCHRALNQWLSKTTTFSEALSVGVYPSCPTRITATTILFRCTGLGLGRSASGPAKLGGDYRGGFGDRPFSWMPDARSSRTRPNPLLQHHLSRQTLPRRLRTSRFGRHASPWNGRSPIRRRNMRSSSIGCNSALPAEYDTIVDGFAREALDGKDLEPRRFAVAGGA